MAKNKFGVHPYIPNSVPEVQAEMLREIGAASVEELYATIPERLRLKRAMNLPEPLLSEVELKKHVEAVLSRNTSCRDYLSFLGGGCSQHDVPAVCDEINQRSEFLTAYAGEPFEDHGRFQALFEYESLMGELLDMDVVNVPTFDGAQAASTSIRMASRITGRSHVLVSDTVSPDRLLVIGNYCRSDLKIEAVRHCPVTGRVDLKDLKGKISKATAAVYFENPSYLGCVDDQGEKISDLIHQAGGISVVAVDPISLGVIEPPSHYGADIVCGDIQPLGIHMHFGGGHGGFIATRDEERFVREYPSRLFGIEETAVEGEYGFGDVLYERTSFADRDKSKEFVGTAAALWGITAGVYLSLMGPKGMQEIGKSIMQKSQYAAKRLWELRGASLSFPEAVFFKEFVVDFNKTGKSVKTINAALLREKIFGGVDLSEQFPEMGQAALFCVTEIHTKEEIDRLAESLKKILGRSGKARIARKGKRG
jgi:glycine dehydrogenase subunit 1